MKNEDDSFDDVKLVGFVRSDEDVKEAMKDRLSGNDGSPTFWKRFTNRENNKDSRENKDEVKPAAINGHVNIGFHMSESDSCYCSDRAARKYSFYLILLLHKKKY
jgi:hypothetical protein